MDAVAAARDLKVLPLFVGRMKQSRIPRKRRRNSAAVHQADGDLVLSYLN
jgi:hypothetical protein